MPQFAVIGLGRFGERLALLLSRDGAEVIAIDSDGEIVQKHRDDVTLAVCMDSTDEEALTAQGIDKVDCAVVGIGTDFEAAVLTVTLLKKLGVPRVVARAGSGTRGRILKQVGADDVVFPEYESAQRWSNQLMMPHFEEFFELDAEHSLVQVPAPASFVGKTLRKLELRAKYRLNVVAIRRPSGSPAPADEAQPEPDRKPQSEWMSAADPDEPLQDGDILVLIGANADLDKLPTK